MSNNYAHWSNDFNFKYSAFYEKENNTENNIENFENSNKGCSCGKNSKSHKEHFQTNNPHEDTEEPVASPPVMTPSDMSLPDMSVPDMLPSKMSPPMMFPVQNKETFINIAKNPTIMDPSMMITPPMMTTPTMMTPSQMIPSISTMLPSSMINMK
jgi:hypothetical protein